MVYNDLKPSIRLLDYSIARRKDGIPSIEAMRNMFRIANTCHKLRDPVFVRQLILIDSPIWQNI